MPNLFILHDSRGSNTEMRRFNDQLRQCDRFACSLKENSLATSFILMLVSGLLTIIVGLVRRSAKKSLATRLSPARGRREDSYDDSSYEVTPDEISKWSKYVFLLLMGVTVLLLVISIFTIVPTKKVGVVTSFGKPTGTLSNGLHMVWPWEKVTQFDAAIQTDSRVDDQGNDKCTSTRVRLGNQSTACADNSVRWRIVQKEADDLYRDYRGFENVRDSLVTRQLNAAMTEVFATYDPLQALAKGGKFEGGLTDLSGEVETKLREKVGAQIEVLNVLVPLVGFDRTTQQKIDQFQAELANTRIAEQKKETAIKEAAANKALSDSVSNDPNVLVSKCLDVLNDVVKANQVLPAGFSCWPGGQSAVAVRTGK